MIDGDSKGRKWATGPKAKNFYVGRSDECQVKMPTAGSSISGKHLEFTRHVDGGWTVMDNSTFGTLLCGDWPLRKGKKVSKQKRNTNTRPCLVLVRCARPLACFPQSSLTPLFTVTQVLGGTWNDVGDWQRAPNAKANHQGARQLSLVSSNAPAEGLAK